MIRTIDLNTGEETERYYTPEEIEAIANVPQPPAKTYAELRAAEYPSLLDLIDGLVKDDAAQVQAYKDACLAVKAKYPKP